jgi:hypothetical protein
MKTKEVLAEGARTSASPSRSVPALTADSHSRADGLAVMGNAVLHVARSRITAVRRCAPSTFVGRSVQSESLGSLASSRVRVRSPRPKALSHAETIRKGLVVSRICGEEALARCSSATRRGPEFEGALGLLTGRGARTDVRRCSLSIRGALSQRTELVGARAGARCRLGGAVS